MGHEIGMRSENGAGGVQNDDIILEVFSSSKDYTHLRFVLSLYKLGLTQWVFPS